MQTMFFADVDADELDRDLHETVEAMERHAN